MHRIFLSTLALLAPLVPAALAETPAAATADAPFKSGDSAPAALLAAPAVRGEAPTAFKPRETYVITTWNTVGGHNFAPGYNIARTMAKLPADTAVCPLVVMLDDDITPEKLAKRLARPSQQSPFPVIRLTPGTEAERTYARLRGADSKQDETNTLVVRDSRIIWLGSGHNLDDGTLKELTATGFDYDKYIVAKAAYDARTKELMNLFFKELPAADKAGDTAKVEAGLTLLENEPNLHPFLYQRLRDARCMIAMEKGDIPTALAEMQKLADKYPNEDAVQSWVHKMVTTNEPLTKLGSALAAAAASRVAQLRKGENAAEWWQAAAEHLQSIGDKAGALAALEQAERQSGPYRRLAAMRGETAGGSVPQQSAE